MYILRFNYHRGKGKVSRRFLKFENAQAFLDDLLKRRVFLTFTKNW